MQIATDERESRVGEAMPEPSEDSSTILQLRAALRASEQRYQQLVEAVTTYTYSVTLRDGVPAATRHSLGCLAATGYSPADYANDPYLWFTMIHVEDRATVNRHIAELFTNTSVPPIEHRIVHSDGRTRWLRDTMIAHRNPAGQLVQYDGFVEDITDRKCEEERCRRLVESAPDAMVVSDTMGRIVVVNLLTERLFGYGREELLGQPVEMLIPEQLRAQHERQRQAYSACPHARPMGGIPAVVCRRRDGTVFPADVSLCPLDSDEGTLIYAAIRDITDRQQAEAQARESAVQLLAAKRIQERLLPEHPPRVAGFDIAGDSLPADTVGGDSYDFLSMPDGAVWLAIGDVSGHGFPAALMMASTHAYLRSLVRIHSDPGSILRLANTILSEETGDERFVTLLLLRLDPARRSLVYCGAGHPAGYVLNAAGAIEHHLPSAGFPLGITSDDEFPSSEPVTLASGDTVVLITDGVFEARSPAGQQYGTERVLNVVRRHRKATSREIIANLFMAIQEHSQSEKLADDITAVVVRVD